MKTQKFKIVIILIFLFTIFQFSACKKKDNNLVDSKTKIYYKNSGFTSISLSNDLEIFAQNNDSIVYFDDNTIMVKSGTIINIKPKEICYKLCYNNIFANFKIGKLLKILINDIEIASSKENKISIVINGKTNISSKYINFEISGVSVLIKENKEQISKFNFSNATLSSENGSLYYIMFNDNYSIENLNQSDFSSNVYFDFSLLANENSKYNLTFSFELFENDNMEAYLILKDESLNQYLVKMNFNEIDFNFEISNISNSNFEIDTIKLEFDNILELDLIYDN